MGSWQGHRVSPDEVALLIRASLGEVKADLVLRKPTLINVYTGELLDRIDVAVKDGRVVFVGEDASHTIGLETKVVELNGKYLAPSFVDAHTHLDIVLSLSELSKGALLHGTTSVFGDCIRMVGVMGYRGFQVTLDAIRSVPLRIFLLVPFDPPQDSALAYSNTLGVDDFAKALGEERVSGVGEVYNWPKLLSCDAEYLSKVAIGLSTGRRVEGHASGARGAKLSAYFAAGMTSCHESLRIEDAMARLRNGVFTMLRQGSLRKELPALVPGLVKSGVDTRNMGLVSDYVDAPDLVERGYMDAIVRDAIELGLDPVKAIQMATINPAVYFQVDRLIGGLAAHRFADMVVLRRLEKVDLESTYIAGKIASKDGKLVLSCPPTSYPAEAYGTIRCGNVEPSMLMIRAPLERGRAKIRVIRMVSEGLTRAEVKDVSVEGGYVIPPEGLLYAAVIDRHRSSGALSSCLVEGFGASFEAFATSLSFDANNIVVVGSDLKRMADWVNILAREGGGMILTDAGTDHFLPLRVCGVVSDKGLWEVSEAVKVLNSRLREMGSPFEKPLHSLLLIGDVIIPEVRLTEKGLVDVKSRKLIPLFIDDGNAE